MTAEPATTDQIRAEGKYRLDTLRDSGRLRTVSFYDEVDGAVALLSGVLPGVTAPPDR